MNVEKLEMELNGNGASVYGTNASGKSTIMDAWWLAAKEVTT